MPGPRTGPGEARDLAVVHLAAGMSQRETADLVGVHPQTVYRWMADPEYRDRVDAVSSQVLDVAVRRLRAAASVVSQALIQIATDPKQKAADRIAAAREVLSRAGITEHRAVEVTGPGGGPVQHVLAEVPDDDVRALLEEVRRRRDVIDGE